MQGSALSTKTDLKSAWSKRAGSSPPPGTILQLRYVVQSIYLNEHLVALFFCGLRRIRINLDTNSGIVRILFVFNAERTYPFFQRARPYTKFISFTLDYGMRCGSLCEFSYQASLSLRLIEVHPKIDSRGNLCHRSTGNSMKNVNESIGRNHLYEKPVIRQLARGIADPTG